MGRGKGSRWRTIKDDLMTVQELAKALGRGQMWATNELRRDSMREVKQWPFATSSQTKTGRWSYVIVRSQFEKWHTGDYGIDYTRLADMVADKVIERLKATTSI